MPAERGDVPTTETSRVDIPLDAVAHTLTRFPDAADLSMAAMVSWR
jgi:hypothetical protein